MKAAYYRVFAKIDPARPDLEFNITEDHLLGVNDDENIDARIQSVFPQSYLKHGYRYHFVYRA